MSKIYAVDIGGLDYHPFDNLDEAIAFFEEAFHEARIAAAKRGYWLENIEQFGIWDMGEGANLDNFRKERCKQVYGLVKDYYTIDLRPKTETIEAETEWPEDLEETGDYAEQKTSSRIS